ncbi:MAG: hypothetical protein ACPGTS_00705 [Minisyncoccia bacterium]
MDDIRIKRKKSDGIRSPRNKKKPTTARRGISAGDLSAPALNQGLSDNNNIRKTKHKKPTKTQGSAKKTAQQARLKKSLPKSQQHLYQEPKKTRKTRKSFFGLIKDNQKILRIIFFAFACCAILFFIFSRLEKTTITLTSKTQNIQEQKNLSAYLNPKYNQLGFDIIAFNEKRSKKITPIGSQQVREYASGTIKIFNNYSSEPQRLSPETRFKSVSGKVFKLGKDGVVIPGKSGDTPGQIEARVYAAEPGPEYNIDVTDFTVPGFQESNLKAKYAGIYGLSVKKFKGGFIGNRPVLSDTERDAAATQLQADLKELLLKRLDAEKTNKVLLVDKSIQLRFDVPELEPLPDGKTQITQNAQIFALLVEKTQLEKYLQKTYIPESHKGQVYLSNFETISFTNPDTADIDFENLKKIPLSIDIQAKFIWNIDTDLLAESLHALDFDQGRTMLREFDEIESAKIQVQPFWQKHISPKIDNIDVQIIDGSR